MSNLRAAGKVNHIDPYCRPAGLIKASSCNYTEKLSLQLRLQVSGGRRPTCRWVTTAEG